MSDGKGQARDDVGWYVDHMNEIQKRAVELLNYNRQNPYGKMTDEARQYLGDVCDRLEETLAWFAAYFYCSTKEELPPGCGQLLQDIITEISDGMTGHSEDACRLSLIAATSFYAMEVGRAVEYLDGLKSLVKQADFRPEMLRDKLEQKIKDSRAPKQGKTGRLPPEKRKRIRELDFEGSWTQVEIAHEVD